MKYLIMAKNTYEDLNIQDKGLGRVPRPGETWEVSAKRLKELENNQYGVQFVDVVKEVKKSKSN